MIHIIDLHFQTDHTIAAFLVESRDGPVLVECGPHSVFPQLEKGLAKHGYRVADLKHLLLTHIHFDHAGAAWALAEQGVKIHVHPAGYRHLLAPERLYQSAQRIYGDQMESLWGKMEAIASDQLVMAEDNSEIQVGEHLFKAIHTPGHAVHHIAWQLGEVIFTGDVAGVSIQGGPVVPPCPPPDIFLEAWRDSIARLRKAGPSTLYLTHFGAITEVDLHLSQLESMLTDWAQWMKGPYEAQQSPEAITPVFQAYAAQQLRQAGLDDHGVDQYEAANPAWMSVAGLLRYWRKRDQLLAEYSSVE